MGAFRLFFARSLAVVLVAMLWGCTNGDETILKNMNREKAEEVRQSISKELHVGADEQLIEAFFKRHGIAYSYDGFARRYQAIIRDVSNSPDVDQAIVVHVYVDDGKRFERAEVRDSFTAP